MPTDHEARAAAIWRSVYPVKPGAPPERLMAAIAQTLAETEAAAWNAAVEAIEAERVKWTDKELLVRGGLDIVRGATFLAEGALMRIRPGGIYSQAILRGREASREITPSTRLRCDCCDGLAVLHIARPDGWCAWLCETHHATPIADALTARGVAS